MYYKNEIITAYRLLVEAEILFNDPLPHTNLLAVTKLVRARFIMDGVKGRRRKIELAKELFG